jgi:hypothetical protein
MPMPDYLSRLTDQSGRAQGGLGLDPHVYREIARTFCAGWGGARVHHTGTASYARPVPAPTVVASYDETTHAPKQEATEAPALTEAAARLLEALVRAGYIESKENWRQYFSEAARDYITGAGQTLDFFPLPIEECTHVSDWDAICSDWTSVGSDFAVVWQAVARAHHLVTEDSAHHGERDRSEPAERDTEAAF